MKANALAHVWRRCLASSNRLSRILRVLPLAALLAAASAAGQTIYKSINPDGTVVYSDKPPPEGSTATVIQQKPAASAERSSAADAGHPQGGGAVRGVHVEPINDGAARDNEVQRAAYGPGIPQAPHMAVRAPGPMQGEQSPDGTKTYSSGGQVIMVEKPVKPAPVWDDHVSSVPKLCDKLTTEYDPKNDQTFLQAALRSGRFADLEGRLEALYRPVRVGHCSDRPISFAFIAFDDSAEDLEVRYSQWLSTNPKSPWPRIARGTFVLQRGLAARGDKYVKDTSQEQLAAMRVLLARAKLDLVAAQSIEPENSIAAAKLVTIARYDSSRDETRQLFERYRKLLPRSYAVVMAYTRNLQVKWGGNPKELTAFIGEVASHADLNPDFALVPSYGMCLLADDLRSLDHREEAEKLKEKAALRYAGKLETWCYSKELVARAERNRSVAEELAGPVDATAGRLPELKHGASAAEGRELLDRQLVTEHGSADLYCRRAWYSYQAGKYEEARDFVMHGVAIDPHASACVRESAKLARLTKPLMEAPTVDELASAEKESGRDASLHFEYGLALIKTGRLDAAEAQFTEAIALDGQSNGAWYRRGWVRARTGQLTLALADLDKAIEIAPKPAVYWAERGRALLLLKQFDAASKDLAQAERLNSKDVATQAYFAALYEATGDCRRVDAYRKVAVLCEKQSCDAGQRDVAAKLSLPDLHRTCAAQFADGAGESAAIAGAPAAAKQ